MKKLNMGDLLPEFKLQNQKEQWVNSNQLVGESALVIYFYPKDDTPGCTAEACAFRDQYEDFTAAGAKVIGISADAVESHKQFAEKYRLSFDLLSDTNNEVRRSFGVPKSMLGLLPGRVTYVFDKKGRLIHQFNSQFNAKKHIEEALVALRK
ncbi:MAG: peroxiredoxin [Bacteroidetes bacterium]|nr:peroxiredoxin [Bacteroidota bacterium]MBU1579798.1 peroxiredoxin [Bacteroidota bacterium]MBU2557321.1 peroxiredoxin [Bacteroidota bacterium]